MAPLTTLTAAGLENLFLASNKIAVIEGLSFFTGLRILELGFNRIRNIEELAHLKRLEELWLGRNRITKIENMSALTNLRKLSLQSNRLDNMNGMSQRAFVADSACARRSGILYLPRRSLPQSQRHHASGGAIPLRFGQTAPLWPQGLQSLSKLRVLDVSSNRVAKVEGLEAQTTLEDLWLNDNQLDEWDGLYESLEGPRQTLTTIYLENNPIVRIVFTPTLSSQSLFAGRTSELQDTCACNATQADAVRCRRSSNMKAR